MDGSGGEQSKDPAHVAPSLTSMVAKFTLRDSSPPPGAVPNYPIHLVADLLMSPSIDPQRLKLSDDGLHGVLLGFQCLDCGVRIFGPATFCQSCTSGSLSSVEFGARGKLFSFTVVRVPPPGWPGPVPYLLGEVELSEGPHVLAEVVDADSSSLTVGMMVELVVAPVPGHPQGRGRQGVPVASRSRETIRKSFESLGTND